MESPPRVVATNPASGARRFPRWVVGAAALGLVGAALIHARHFYHDDAYITLRYAQRWLAGKGPTWTDGERVQGFTHPLWLMQVVLLAKAGIPLQAATRVLGIAYLAGIGALWWRMRLWSPPLLIVATFSSLALWSLGGIETTGFAFWLVLGAVLSSADLSYASFRLRPGASARTSGAFRDGAVAGLAWSAAALHRPEGLATAFVAMGWALLSHRRRFAAGMAAALLLPVAVWLLFSRLYYGDLLPNPAWVKLDAPFWSLQVGSAKRYLVRTSAEWLPGTVALGLAFVLLLRRGTAVSVGFWLSLLLPTLASLIAAGGDHMDGVRLLVPVVVLAGFGVGSLGPPRGRWVAGLGQAAIALAASWQEYDGLTRPRPLDAAAAVGEPVGHFLEMHLPAGALVACATAGSTPYFAPSLRFIDTLGLNDAHIARRAVRTPTARQQWLPGHLKGDGAYVFARQPDVILLGPAEGELGTDPNAWFLTDRELLLLPSFHESYVPYRFVLQDGPNLTAYLRRRSTAAAQLALEGEILTPPWN